MKMMKYSAMAAMTLACWMAFTPVSRAQDNKSSDNKPKADAPQRPRGGANAQDRAKRMVDELNLSAEQKEKFQAAMKEQNDKLRDLRQDTNLSQEDRRTKSADIRKNTAAKMKEILSAEQFEKWQKLNQGGGQRGGGQGQRGGGRRGPGGGGNGGGQKPPGGN